MQYFAAVYRKTSDLLTSHPWVKDQIDAHLIKINETVEYVNKKMKEQMDKPLNENPVVYVTNSNNLECRDH